MLLQISYVGYETMHDIHRDYRMIPNPGFHLQESAVVSDAVIISAVRASQNTPTTFTIIEQGRNEPEKPGTGSSLYAEP